jgi:hypothetical protein
MYSIQEPVRRKTREDDFEIRPTIVHQVLVEKFTSDIVGIRADLLLAASFLVSLLRWW